MAAITNPSNTLIIFPDDRRRIKTAIILSNPTFTITLLIIETIRTKYSADATNPEIADEKESARLKIIITAMINNELIPSGRNFVDYRKIDMTNSRNVLHR